MRNAIQEMLKRLFCREAADREYAVGAPVIAALDC